ncbi:MAG: hypothetical protein EOP85_10500 [Verrucomicrobiaceae bacterium]|nr:MAG: hypothetical protein EOP85_10500 [Verrucomicrobiaceae bacterium]
MSGGVSITGVGAVSPAGWGMEPLMGALRPGETITPSSIERASGDTTVSTPVPRTSCARSRGN